MTGIAVVIFAASLVVAVVIRQASRALAGQISHLVTLLDRLEAKVTANGAASARIEVAAAVVASDLEDAHHRADEVSGAPGAAADAAAQSSTLVD